MAIRNWMLEALVAKKIGVARSVIAAYRKNLLERDRDWRLERNQAGKTMKSHRQRGFVKMQCAILDRFDDRDARHVYEDLLCLMDHEGRIQMVNCPYLAK
jgi:hypothetical protein